MPKPMVEIGGRPILWHVIQIYLAQGFRRFLLLTGYRGEQISRFVDDQAWPAECVDPLPGHRRRHAHRRAAAPGRGRAGRVRLLPDLRRRRGRHRPRRSCCAYHAGHDAPATMTVVRPELQFGVAELDRRRGRQRRSPRSHAASTGSTAASSACARRCSSCCSADTVLEREPLAALAAGGGLRAFRHEGFWDCMDTYKDAVAAQRPVGQRRGAVEAVGLTAGAPRVTAGRSRSLRHRRPRAARRLAGQGAARRGRARGRDPPRRADGLGARDARTRRAASTSSTATSASPT